ncbi:MAG TPA: M23 family metallopeptidase, partial [Gaiellaceae bacterium]|nr:M23 family metallopeptidase [Gaiellaceae bacterium]
MRRVLSAAVVLATLAVAPAALGWTWPVQGPVLRPYSFTVATEPYPAGQHRGVDVGAAPGTEVRAPAAGTVSFVGSLPQGGRALTIQTADGYSVTLLQLAETLVERGAAVAEGDVVARSGPSADPLMAQSHVHLGIRLTAVEDGYVDPLELLPAAPAEPVPPATVPSAAVPAAAEPASAEPQAVVVAALPAGSAAVEPPPADPLPSDPPPSDPPRPAAPTVLREPSPPPALEPVPVEPLAAAAAVAAARSASPAAASRAPTRPATPSTTAATVRQPVVAPSPQPPRERTARPAATTAPAARPRRSPTTPARDST